MGTAALVLGIFSIIFGIVGDCTCFLGVGIIFGSIGAFFGLIALGLGIAGKITRKGGPTTGGLVVSIIGCVFSTPAIYIGALTLLALM